MVTYTIMFLKTSLFVRFDSYNVSISVFVIGGGDDNLKNKTTLDIPLWLNVSEPGALKSIGGSDSLFRVQLQHFVQEIQS